MSQFDFPRVHFKGAAILDPATGNNNYHYPLVTYEPVTGTVVMPPRLYLDDPDDLALVEAQGTMITRHICFDESRTPYISIAGVDNPEVFKSWNTTPLGRHSADLVFHPLYAKIRTRKEAKKLLGQHPGYWNYYGTMNFELDKVAVHNIQLFENGRINNYHSEMKLPDDLMQVMGAEVTFWNHRGGNAAVMIDLAPTLSLYSQVFCDFIKLSKEGKILMVGKPLKASLRQMNPARVINDPTITGASGTFCTSLSLDNLQEVSHDFIEFFQKNGRTNKKFKGLFLRYNLYGIEENQFPDYDKTKITSNPAQSMVLGSFSPWYEGEMETAIPGRLLLPKKPYLNQQKLGPMLVHFDAERNVLSCDAIETFPIVRTTMEPACWYLYKLGILDLCILSEKGDTMTIGTIEIGRGDFSFEGLVATGGLIDIFLTKNGSSSRLLAKGGELRLVTRTQESKKPHIGYTVLLSESKYRILSDQTGLYADQGDDPANGYLSNRAHREPCVIRVFKHGLPYTKSIVMMYAEVSVNSYGRGEKIWIFNDIGDFKDRTQMTFPTDEAGIRFYVFVPVEEVVIPTDFLHYMLMTGSYVNLRVLPKYSYEALLDPAHPDEVDFPLIYEEFLRHYDLIYPASGIITPFESDYLQKVHTYLKKLMSEDAWDQYLFMPSTRDFPRGKRELFFYWLDSYLESKE